MMRVLYSLPAVFLLLHCGTPTEGRNPGECSDKADNDGDGYFDCNDIDCMMAPDCEGDTDTDTDTDTDSDTDSDTDVDAIASHLKSYTVDYTLHWDFDDAFEVLLQEYGLVDCTNVYRGSGSQTDASGDRVSFQGEWKLIETDCKEELADPQIVWFNKNTGESYSSFYFAGSIDLLDVWIQHRDADDISPLGSPNQNGQWYITAMNSPFNTTTFFADHTETEETAVSGVPTALVHSASFQFSTSN